LSAFLLLNDGYLQTLCIDVRFLFAFWAVEGIVY
jgi:hypothetical protein